MSARACVCAGMVWVLCGERGVLACGASARDSAVRVVTVVTIIYSAQTLPIEINAISCTIEAASFLHHMTRSPIWHTLFVKQTMHHDVPSVGCGEYVVREHEKEFNEC